MSNESTRPNVPSFTITADNGRQYTLYPETNQVWREAFVDSAGRTFKAKENAVGNNGHGYRIINVGGKKSKNLYYHRLVAEHYWGDCKHLTVNHKDGNPNNNHPLNLEWMSQAMNLLDAEERNGYRGKGKWAYMAQQQAA